MGTRTQDLIFTLYGDYISRRGGTAWIGCLIELLGALGTSEQAVRSTASRMARKGWLRSKRRGRNSYYSLTPKAVDLLAQGDRQIFDLPPMDWDGHWYMVTYAFSDKQGPQRHRLRKRISWLGFGQLASGTWLSPRDRHAEVSRVLDELDVRDHVDYFRTEHVHFAERPSLAERCWDLDDLNESYRAFVEKYEPLYERDCLTEESGGELPLDYAFRRRFEVVHEYRYFPFRDPYLPDELLPETWMGQAAIDLFQAYHRFLRARANDYVDHVIARAP